MIWVVFLVMAKKYMILKELIEISEMRVCSFVPSAGLAFNVVLNKLIFTWLRDIVLLQYLTAPTVSYTNIFFNKHKDTLVKSKQEIQFR